MWFESICLFLPQTIHSSQSEEPGRGLWSPLQASAPNPFHPPSKYILCPRGSNCGHPAPSPQAPGAAGIVALQGCVCDATRGKRDSERSKMDETECDGPPQGSWKGCQGRGRGTRAGQEGCDRPPESGDMEEKRSPRLAKASYLGG